MAEREHILADFQACTGIDNFDECFVILEQHDWNLIEAVKNAMEGTQDQYPAASSTEFAAPTFTEDLARFSSVTHEASVSVMDSTESETAFGVINPPSTCSFNSMPSTSRGYPASRPINFTIEYRDRNIKLVLLDNEHVRRIKDFLEVELQIPADQQELCGWVNKHDKLIEDNDMLRDLKLPKENTLVLITPNLGPGGFKPNDGESQELVERLSQTFTLNIRYKEKHYALKFPGNKTIQEVKTDMFSLIEVPVRHQIWTGWPEHTNDDTMTLAGCGIGYPCHSLQVNSAQPVESKHSSQILALQDDTEDSDDEFADAPESFEDEVMFEPSEIGGRKAEQLMPENAKDQTAALEGFTREFSARYGEVHPVFYIGGLEDALHDAFQCRIRERRMLAIYLHHDGSILSNVFCSQVLCSETIVDYLKNNFITWAWDLTSEINRSRLLSMCMKHFGSVAANTVRNFKPDGLPLLLIISRNRASNEVVNVLHGNATADEIMPALMQAVEVFQEQQQSELAEEEEREAREMVKMEQDEAYRASLAADKAKAEQKRKEEEEILQQQMEEEVKRQKRREEDDEKEAIRMSVADQLPDEPSADCTEPVATIKIRCPGNVILTRRFLAQNPLQIVLNFITSKGFHITDYKVLTTYPRRDLTQMDSNQTLDVLKLYPQETLILEEK